MEEFSRKKTVRNLRILYPLWVLVGIFSIMYVPSQLIDHDSAMTTAETISNNTTLYRLGIFGSLLTQLLFIIIPLLLFRLFEKVNRFQSILMLLLALVSVPMTMYSESSKLMVLELLDQPELMMLSLDSYYEVMTIAMIFWGLWLFPLGILVYRSGYFPKIFGYFLIAAGFGYLLDAFTGILMPTSSIVRSFLEILTFGELLFILWLVIRGVKVNKEIRD